MTHPIGAGGISRRMLLGGLAASACDGARAPCVAQPKVPRGCGNADCNQREDHCQLPARPARCDAVRRSRVSRRLGAFVANEDFGGWSGLVMEADGRSLLSYFRRRLLAACRCRLCGRQAGGLAGARLGSLRALRGRSLRDKREQDAEALTLVDGSLERGTLLIGFERLHRIGRFEDPRRTDRSRRPNI